jgi:nitroimidazol reductase NimA-like FMN-containing flavoprotein (pyridoxamine 5'-phosphate oxidase superfamily)
MVDEQQAWLEELRLDECLALLRIDRVGRIATVVNDAPIVVPINYQLVEVGERNWIALRTRPGGVLDRTPVRVAFEIDGVDPIARRGWSVLVRGTLQPVDPDAAEFRDRFDPHPWLADERDSWLVIEPFAITGRRLHAAEADWPFSIRGYL